jgi:hypothetical protein
MTDEIKDPIDPTPEGAESTTEEGGGTPVEKCPHCERKEEEQAQMDELNLAILIALVPALTITLFST